MKGLYPIKDPEQLELEHQVLESLKKPKTPTFLPEYKIEAVVTKDGKVISKKSWKSKTWVFNFIRMLYGLFGSGAGTDVVVTLTDTGGNARNFPAMTNTGLPIGSVLAGALNTDYGILVGAGASPSYSASKYSLDSPIGPGAMEPSETTIEISVENVITISRSFANKSGSDLTVTEVALVIDWQGFYFMVAYDVPSGGISVPAGATLTLRYVISLS